MSQDYFTGKGKAVRQPATDEGEDDSKNATSSTGPAAPAYVTVGTGSTSQHAARLQAILDQDSGYGGSTLGDADDNVRAGAAWMPSGLHGDRDMPLHSGSPRDQNRPSNPAADRRLQAAAVHQLWYNQHRVSLGRAINRAVDTLRTLQEFNVSWPAHYPSVRRADAAAARGGVAVNGSAQQPRPGIQHTSTTSGDFASSTPFSPTMKRSMTSVEDESAESSKAAERRTAAAAEPRLVTPQIAQEFSILKLDLKLGSLHQTELVHSLEKGSIASLLDGKISSSIKHLMSLRERIEDTSSKVLVTGDLNAGKSTFCNALLRRKILPEDQQPCTAIFCEVLDARENDGLEEVHAVHKEASYSRNNETTYDVYKLSELEKVVTDNNKYTQCKVYVRDARTIDESLLNNGVVDIALIDAPGLNSDTTKTTAVFARQEEIDVVVFVVSAANHFTISAKEFIWAAAAEKAYLFIVVNQFDTIRDKERCQKMILDQVHGLSPRTWKEAGELVHFVSSDAIPMAPGGGPGGSGSGSGGGGGDGDDPGDDPKGKGKDKEKIEDFGKLEQSLRRFVLEKRARSKLAPAKTYLYNILSDLKSLADVNTEVAQSELDRVAKELGEIEPQLESSKRANSEVKDDVEKTIDAAVKEVYDSTRSSLTLAIDHAGDGDLGVPYPGLLRAFAYAEDLKVAMLSSIAAAVTTAEESARVRTVSGVNAIKQLGLLHLGGEYADLSFRPDVMFRHRRHQTARQVDVPTDLWDFVDWSTILQRQEKVAGTGMALTVATAVGTRLIGGAGWMDHAFSAAKILGNDNLRRLIIPGIVVVAISATAYVLNQIPNSLPHKLSAKISAQLSSTDYVHTNATRISGSVGHVLRIPADDLRVRLQRSVEQLGTRREETLELRTKSEGALKYFRNLVRESEKQRDVVSAVDLDSNPPGAAQGWH